MQESVIIIMGPTGSGKSNFVNKLIDIKEDKAACGLKSHTQSIREFHISTSNGVYVFVDTPRFDDTYRSDREVLRMIANWLEEKYRGNVKPSGIIYTHRITDNRMSGSVCKNLDMFSKICGDKSAERVRLVTTMWDRVKDQSLSSSRVAQLEGNFWRPLIDLGARHRKFHNTQQSAWEIISDVVGKSEATLLQEELVDAERRLNETTAGRGLYTQSQRLLQEQKDTIKRLGEEAKVQQDPKLAKELEVEYKRIEAQLQKTWEEVDKLKLPFLRRLTLFFSKKTKAHTIEINTEAMRNAFI